MVQDTDSDGPQGEPSTPAPAADVEHLSRKAQTGAVWTVLGFGGGNVVRLLANLALTRLLFEEFFGLMALVNTFLLGLQLFSDIGVGPALVQNKREDPDFVNTVWTINVVRGAVLCLVAMVLAGPYATFYEQPILAPLVRVAALASLIGGFRSASFFTQSRRLNLERLVVIEIGAALLGTAVMVVWAWMTRSIWALVWGGIVTATFTTILSHVWLPGIRNRFRFEKRAAYSLVSFGGWIFFSTLFTFAAENLDRLVFGKWTTMATLGVYSIALLLSTTLKKVFGKLAQNVLFPLYSAIRYSKKDLSETYASARWPLLVVSGWITSGVVGGGPTIVRLLYDPRYWEAGWMLQILVFGAWFGWVLRTTHTCVALAVGRSDLLAATHLAKVVGLAVFCPLGLSLWGFPGAVLGLAVADLARYAVSVYAALQVGQDGRRKDLTFSIRVTLGALASWATVIWLTDVGVTQPIVHALGVFVVATIFWGRPLFILLGRIRRREAVFRSPARSGPSLATDAPRDEQ
jgi:O-antigen/teichoic acid export membrane protein